MSPKENEHLISALRIFCHTQLLPRIGWVSSIQFDSVIVQDTHPYMSVDFRK